MRVARIVEATVATDRPKRLGLTVYLVKKNVESSALLRERPGLVCHEIGAGENAVGKLYVADSPPHPPLWADFFSDYLDGGSFGTMSSVSAVLVVEAAGRLFALTFGHARHLLVLENLEGRFGLRVALNSLGEQNVRSLDKLTFDAISKQAREQAAREATAREFGIDIEQDLLRAVTGTPADTSLGVRMSGKDALHVFVELALSGLKPYLARLLEKYEDTAYTENFPWVDHIAEVGDKGERSALDAELIERIRSGKLDGIRLAAPDVLSWSKVGGFRLGRGTTLPVWHDVSLDDFVRSRGGSGECDLGSFKRARIQCIGLAGEVLSEWAAYGCLHAELDLGGEVALLTGGQWFRVGRDFVQEVDDFCDRIQAFSGTLPVYDDDNEGDYNERVAFESGGHYALMDRKNIRFGGGQSQVEFCDLFSRALELVHVKRRSGARDMSHLFSQGTVSAELLLSDSGFREKVNDRLPAEFQLENPEERPNPAAFTVVYAIVYKPAQSRQLPFFSRVSLKTAVKRLRAFGYNVRLAEISTDPMRARTQKAPPRVARGS